MGERGDGKVGLKADQKYKMNKGTESVKKKSLKNIFSHFVLLFSMGSSN